VERLTDGDKLVGAENADSQAPILEFVMVDCEEYATHDPTPVIVKLPTFQVKKGLSLLELQQRIRLKLAAMGFACNAPSESDDSRHHGELHRLKFSGGGSTNIIHMAVSVPHRQLETMDSSYDTGAKTWHYTLRPVGNLSPDDYDTPFPHPWLVALTDCGASDDLQQELLDLRYAARLANDATTPSDDTNAAPAAEAPTQHLRLAEFKKEFELTLEQRPCATFSGRPDRESTDRAWIENIREATMRMPPSMSSATMLDMFALSLSDDTTGTDETLKGTSPRAYFLKLIDLNDRKATSGLDELKTQVGKVLDARERQVRLDNWIAAMQKRFPVTQPVKAAIRALDDYELTGLDDFEEQVEHWIACLDNIRRVEDQTGSTTHFEPLDFGMNMGPHHPSRATAYFREKLNELAHLVDKHLEYATDYETKHGLRSDYFRPDMRFLQEWNYCKEYGPKQDELDREGNQEVFVFEGVLRAAYRKTQAPGVGEEGLLTFTDHEGQTVTARGNAGTFAFYCIPVRWILKVVRDFFFAPGADAPTADPIQRWAEYSSGRSRMQLLFEGKTFRPGLPFLTAMAPELEDGRWLKTFSESEDEAEDTDNESEAGDSGSECATDGDSDGDSGSECETETAGVAEEPRPRSHDWRSGLCPELAAYEAFDEGYAASNTR